MVDVLSSADTKALINKKANQPATAGSNGQVLTRDTSSTTGTSWQTPQTGGGTGTVSDATTTSKGIIQLAGHLAGTAAAPQLQSLFPGSATFGSSTKIPQITRDAFGRIASIVEVDAAAATGGGTGGGGGVTATVDGSSVSSLQFVTGITAADVSALPRPTATPSLGQVPAVTAVSPLQLGWITPSGGAGGGASESINVLNQGIKNDGIILNDLVVTAGSKTITSNSNPFTSGDVGKIVYWRTSSGTETGTIASYTSASSVTLVSNAGSGILTDGGPNTNSVFGTDNTAALNSLFTSVQALQLSNGSTRVEQTPAAKIKFPPGVYVTKALNIMKGQGVVVSGQGLHNSYIASGDDNPWFQLDTLNQYYAYSGAATYWQFEDLQFINPCHRNGSSNGNRKGIAIQDNGSGNTSLIRCKFVGLRYGFAGPTATDFSRFRDCYFYLCDVGSYCGPGSQQLDFLTCDWALCNEGAVFEGAPVWHIGGGSSFEDNVKSSVTLDGKTSGTTRFGCPVDLGGAYYSGEFIIDGGGWFETNSGGNGALTPRQILVNGDGPFGAPFEGLVLRDMAFIAGGNQVSGGTNTLVELNTTRSDSQMAVTLHNVSISNPSFVNSAIRNSGSATNLKVLQLFCQFPTQVAETQGSMSLKAQRRNGTMVGFTLS